MLPLYGGADSAIPFPPVCGNADNPPPVLFAKISASVLFRSYSTSPFGNRIWRKKTAHTIKNLPFKNTKPFSRDSVPYPDRGMIPLYPHLQKHKMFLRYQVKGMMPLWEIEVRTAEQMRRLPEGQGLKTLLEQRPQGLAPKVLNVFLIVAEVFEQEITIPPILLYLYPKL